MTTITALEGQTGSSIGSVLRPIHAQWIRRTRRTVEPVLSPSASFWDRWTAVRYLDDVFDEHYRHEVALVGSLVARLPTPAAARLTALTETLDASRVQLDRVGRRRGVASAVSVVAREFLDLFQLWCAEVEEALGGLRRADLPDLSDRLLLALEAAASREP
jgi:hypothetical protein